MARSFLLSYLARKAAFNEKRFSENHPFCWLVLETSARHAEATTQVASTQQGLLNQGGDWPPAGDALCFELDVNEKISKRFRVGRAPGNDIEVIENSVSREHLVLTFNPPGEWRISPLNNTSTFVEGRPISPTASELLPFGAALKLGQAVVRLHDPGSFTERLKKKAAQDAGE